MVASNSWAELAATYLRTREAHGEHELAKAELKELIPEDAKEATGHGIKTKRSKSGANQLRGSADGGRRCISLEKHRSNCRSLGQSTGRAHQSGDDAYGYDRLVISTGK